MLRILKFLISAVLFLAFVGFGATVNLGDRTLFGHLYAIGQTKESQDLVKGTKDKAQPVVDDVRRRLGNGSPDAASSPPVPVAPPQEAITDSDRKKLGRVISAARQAK